MPILCFVVMNVMEETLLDCQQRRRSDDDDTGPYNIADALITAAIEEGVHLDCVYFLLRRHPGVLQEILSPLPCKSKLRKRRRDRSLIKR